MKPAKASELTVFIPCGACNADGKLEMVRNAADLKLGAKIKNKFRPENTFAEESKPRPNSVRPVRAQKPTVPYDYRAYAPPSSSTDLGGADDMPELDHKFLDDFYGV